MSTMRITGMSSGLDIDEMVKELVDAEKTRIDSYEQDNELIEWKQDAYHSVSEKYANFILDVRQSFDFTSTTLTGHIDDSRVDRLSWTKTATISDERLLSASASQSSANGTYKISVSQLAENFSSVSSSKITTGVDASNLMSQFGLTDGVDKIAFTIETALGMQEFDYVSNLGTLSLDDIASDINQANLGVHATYDHTLDRFFFQTTETGSDSTVKLTSGTSTNPKDGSVVDFLTGTNALLGLGLLDQTSYSGKNAIFSYNGVDGLQKESNNFEMNGIQFDFKNTTIVNGTLEKVTINVTTDVDQVYDRITSFVDKYNEMMTFANTLVQEKKDRDFDPLTTSEKEELSESEIATYLKKAKVGVISNDLTITSITSRLRSALLEDVAGTKSFSRLNEVGIKTAEASAGGKLGLLAIDEDQLKEAIRKDADGVIDLLFKTPDDVSLTTTYEKNLTSDQISLKRSQSGIFNRVSDILSNGITDLIGKAGYGKDDSLYRSVNGEIMLNFNLKYSSLSMLDQTKKTLASQVDRLSDRLEGIEDNYYQMFSKMESLLNNMNSQSAWLASNMM